MAMPDEQLFDTLHRRRTRSPLAVVLQDADERADFIASGYEIAIEEPAALVCYRDGGDGEMHLVWMRSRRPGEARQIEQLERHGAQVAGTYRMGEFIPFRDFERQALDDLAPTLESMQ